MGNTDSSLAMMAVSRKIFLKKVHILLLRFSMKKFSDDFGMIDREGFDRARSGANLTKVEVFDLLFTMWEAAERKRNNNNNNSNGAADSGKVSTREFCVGISPLACPSGDLSTILEFALRVSNDGQGRNTSEGRDLHELLTGINSTASYFGDKHLLPVEINRIVEMVFEESDRISHEDCTKRLLKNAYVKRFASGKARACVQFKERLETNFIFDKEKLVTEYIVDDIDALLLDDEKENVSVTHKDYWSSPVREDRETIGEGAAGSGDAPRWRSSEHSAVVPFATASGKKPDSRDENSREEETSGYRDPPPADKYETPRRIEISYSTYQQQQQQQQQRWMSRDPSPRMSSGPSPTIFR